jgi:hypothetical protein
VAQPPVRRRAVLTDSLRGWLPLNPTLMVKLPRTETDYQQQNGYSS